MSMILDQLDHILPIVSGNFSNLSSTIRLTSFSTVSPQSCPSAVPRIGSIRWEAVIRRVQTEGGVIELLADRNGLKLTTFSRSLNVGT